MNLGRYGNGWGRLGTEGESCSYVPRHLDEIKNKDGGKEKANFSTNKLGRTFVFCGGPELGQLGGVRPIKVRLQVNGWAVRPWLSYSSSSSSSRRGAPKNKDIVFGGVVTKEWISDGYFGRIWVDRSKTSKSDVDGRIDDGREYEIGGEDDQERVYGHGYD